MSEKPYTYADMCGGGMFISAAIGHNERMNQLLINN
jgi:hypothetical protein